MIDLLKCKVKKKKGGVGK